VEAIRVARFKPGRAKGRDAHIHRVAETVIWSGAGRAYHWMKSAENMD
jgi:hypothetical protein